MRKTVNISDPMKERKKKYFKLHTFRVLIVKVVLFGLDAVAAVAAAAATVAAAIVVVGFLI